MSLFLPIGEFSLFIPFNLSVQNMIALMIAIELVLCIMLKQASVL
jgi:hypothetical protein